MYGGVPSADLGEAVSIFENGLRRAIEAIVVCGGPFFGDFQWRLASLPIRFGGLGLCSAEDVSTYAFVASRAQSWCLQDHILEGCGIDEVDSDYGYALDRVRMSLPDFDLSGFSNKDTAPPRAQNVLACALFSEIVKSHPSQVMARLSLATRKLRQRRKVFWNLITTTIAFFLILIWVLILKYQRNKPRIGSSSSKIDRYLIMHRHVYGSDIMSISQIRMTRTCFSKLCHMLETFGGLRPTRNMDVDEQVAIFLHIVAHNAKNRVMICRFHRSTKTISRCFTRVCNAVIRLHPRLLKKPEPVSDNSTHQRWKWFKNCLGALDGTYIKCLVPLEDKPSGMGGFGR
nr:hypothetical protein [Tanacetum cinerariifolium]